MLFLRLSTHYCFSLRIWSGSEKDNLILFIRFCLIMYFRSLKCMFVGRPCIYGLLSQIYSEIQDFNSKGHRSKAWINPWVSLDLSAVIQIWCVIAHSDDWEHCSCRAEFKSPCYIANANDFEREVWGRSDSGLPPPSAWRKNGRRPKCSRVDKEACE